MTPRERARIMLEEWGQYRVLTPNATFDAAIDFGIFKEHLSYWFQALEQMLIDDVGDDEITLWLDKLDTFYCRFRDNLMMSILKNGTTNRH